MLRAMMRDLSLTVIACALALALPSLAACIDMDRGETGHYSAPCTGSFYDILLCARETGGAPPPISDPINGADEIRFTCADACQVMVDCSYIVVEDFDPCVSSCLRDAMFDQAVLNCIRDNMCDVNQCFAGL